MNESNNTGKAGHRHHLGLSGKRNASLESITSITSQGGRSTRRTSQSDQSISGVSDIRQFGPNLFDCVAVIIRCPKHAKFGLCKIGGSRGNAYWFPYKSLRTTESWYITVLKLCKRVLHVAVGGTNRKSNLAFSVPELVHVLRTQLPQYMEFIHRVIFATDLTHDPKYPQQCCQSNSNITWFSAKEIAENKLRDNVWGPEPEVFTTAIQSQRLEKGNYTEITIMDALKFAPKAGDKALTYQEEMFRSSGYQTKDITTIFSEFIQHCYPSQYMSWPSFNDYMNKIGLAVHDIELKCLYRAFSFNFMPYISFYEFSLGLASMEKSASHGGNCGKLRTRYIYRYYSTGPLSGGNDFLDYNSMRKMTADILRHRQSSSAQKTSPNADIEADIKNNYNCLGVVYKEKVNFAQFEKSVGAMKMRGTSSLFRCSQSPITQLRLKPVYGELTLMRTPDDIANNAKARDAGCAKCRQKKYTLAKHIVKTLADGTIVNPQLTKQSDVKQMPKEMMHLSNEAFTATTPANVILDALKEFALKYGLYVSSTGSKSQKSSHSSGNSDSSGGRSGGNTDWASQSCKLRLQPTIKALLNQSIDLLKRSARVIKINSPCYVLGDIHGNLRDLMTYEQILWRMAPTCLSSSYLFLGDIVDRGEYGLECILYLLANKIISPFRFHLLRGNHELRTVQTQFTFKKECDVKFGAEYGPKIWEHLNQVFDVMPVCAVIDESIFCAHGGIPTHATLIKQLYAIPCPLSAPENEDKGTNDNGRLAWEILWNDPITQNEYKNGYALLKSQSSQQQLNKYPKGFLPNTKRGTAYFFSDEAVDTFLTANRLSHVIRAHEMIPPGYAFHMNGKVITIFSCSNYGNANNESACALVDQSKIRIIQLDTNQNK